MSERWISSKAADQISNRIARRAVVGWEMIGSHYFRGHKLPGYTRLLLSGGGWLWFPDSVSLKDAVTEARERGFDVSEVHRKIENWLKTGDPEKET